ncbi:MAG: hypothetical protein EP335_13755 [Alphaproteobacteria bacterium]|nr:MAG: hypothetical protein EP335_13755 [Alphaproteobacteria bacterium]
MSTRIGFYMFIGLIVGAYVGQWLPFVATVEAIAGGVIAAVLGGLIDWLVASFRKKRDFKTERDQD